MKTENKLKTTAVIVTYGNRWPYLKRLLDILMGMDAINTIVIVDNGSVLESKTEMNSYIHTNKKKQFVLIPVQANMGSAIGFGTGINTAKDHADTDFIWLLDDDLQPKHDALDNLYTVWHEITKKYDTSLVALCSNRLSKVNYQLAVLLGDPEISVGKKNYFRSFHILRVIHDIKFKNFVKKNKNELCTELPEYGEIYCAPYGGLFFHKSLIGTIGLPNESYYLYVDDTDYTYNIVLKGGKIFLATNSIINDIEESWNTSIDSYAIKTIATITRYNQLFYSIRNKIYFEKKYLITNWGIYCINGLIYTLLVFILALVQGKFKNIKVFAQALHDGLRGKMGINPKYTLQ
ncbi:MAG: glycosyltransferase [Spirochaetota bacterium]